MQVITRYTPALFESSVKLVWSPIRKTINGAGVRFESSVKLVWSPITKSRNKESKGFESSVKLVWSPIWFYANA